MPTNQDDSLGAQIGVRIPSNLNTAVEQYANERSYQLGAHDSFVKSDAVREAIDVYVYILALADELPEETRDLLDVDLKANAGDDIDKPSVLKDLGISVDIATNGAEGNRTRAVTEA